MEELLNKANSKNSFFGSICQIIAILGGGISVIVFLINLENIRFSTTYAFGGLGISGAIGAIGTTANQSKRQTELLNIFVRANNSAYKFKDSKPPIELDENDLQEYKNFKLGIRVEED